MYEGNNLRSFGSGSMSSVIKNGIEWKLKEIIHKPVTFTKETLQKDNDELNEALRKGYYINDVVRTQTGIVYVLTKWSRKKQKKSENTEEESKLPSLFSLIGGVENESN